MRIISGVHKSRRIAIPKNLPVRPTTDMSREALFNILNNRYYFDELTVLDLFAGTGYISYEFASRGAQQVTAIEKHYACTSFISRTAETLEMPINIIRSDVYKFLENSNQQYSIIFADPPYDFSIDQFGDIPKLVFEKKLLKKDGCLIVEHSKHSDLSQFENYQESRKYGGSVFSFFS